MKQVFTNNDQLKKRLNDIQHFLIQHKEPKDKQKASVTLSQQQQQRLRHKISHLHAADIAHLIEGLEPEDRKDVWTQIPVEQQGAILLSLPVPVRDSMLANMPIEAVVTATDNFPGEEIGDLASLAQSLPDAAVEHILKSLSAEQRNQFEDALSYPAGTVGSLMDFSILTARPEDSVNSVLSYCRKLSKLPEHSHHIYIVDQNNVLLGLLPIQELITLPFDTQVGEVIHKSMITFITSDKAEQAAFAFDRYELISAPIVDDDNKLIGRICVDDIVDFMRENTEQQMLHQIGFMNREDRFAGLFSMAKNRWLWLTVNLISAFIATRVIGVFEDKIIELVMLATLMPIVSATAGNIGNQACTLIIRSLALGQVTDSNVRQFYIKEVGISLINGLIWGGVMGVFVANIYSPGIGAVMGFAMLLNFVFTSIVAVSIPIVRHKFNLDPAMGAHVLVAFFADAFGFFVFLGMATAFL